MNRKRSRPIPLTLILCVCAALSVGCATPDTKEDKGGAEQHGGKVGAEDFMPERTRTIYMRSCASCHGPGGHGILAVAPDLYRAKHRAANEWEKYLRESRDAHPVGNPPPLWLDGDETREMAEYLESVTQRNQ